MLVLAGDPGAQAGDERGRLQGGGHRHEHVASVDGGRPGGRRGLEAGRVVERRPLVRGQEVGHLQPGAQTGVLDEGLTAHVLACQQGGIVVEDRGAHPLRGPVGGAGVGPAGLVDDGVEREPAAEGQALPQVVAEGPGVGVALQEVVDRVRSPGPAQQGAERAQALGSYEIPSRRPQLAPTGLLNQGRHAVAVLGEAGVVLLALEAHRLVAEGVDLVDAVPDGGQATGDVDLLQALGVLGEVPGDAEPSEGLAQQAPALQAQSAAQVLAVLDDLIGAQVSEQPGGVCWGAGGIGPVHRAGGSGAALVDEDESVVLEDRTDPAEPGVGTGAGCLAARPALKEDQWRPGDRVDAHG